MSKDLASILTECENYFSQGCSAIKDLKPETSAVSDTNFDSQPSDFERLLFSDSSSNLHEDSKTMRELENDCAALTAKLHSLSFPDPTMFQTDLTAE